MKKQVNVGEIIPNLPFTTKKVHFVEKRFFLCCVIVYFRHGEDPNQKKGCDYYMSTWYVTFSALRRYAKEARAAQEQLNDAKEAMKNAAEELCNNWKGDASIAFGAEQGLLSSWFAELISIGSEYIAAVEQAVEKYQQAEADLASKVSG